jgi:hypothetical protein
MKWLSKIFGWFKKGSYEPVFQISGTWNINSPSGTYNEYCHFTISYNKVKNHYKLESTGYRPKNHGRYEFVFNATVRLNEGTYFAKGGELFEKNVTTETEKEEGFNVETLNETQCEAYLKRALEDEDYELAEKLRIRLEKLR